MKLLNIFIAMILTILARIINISKSYLMKLIKYIKVLLDEILLGEIFKVVGKKKFEICLSQ
jgi:hypothetical protein